MPITDYVGIVKVSGQEYLTGSTLFGICTNAEYEPAKIVKIESITNFTPTHGLTIHILFTNSNTATRPTIQFSTDSEATKYPIYQFGTTKVGNSISTSWRAGAIVSLTFIDGELEQPATDKRWVLNSSIDTDADGGASVTLNNVQNADDLKAIEALTSTGYLKRTGDETWALQTLDVTGGSASQTLTGIIENNGNIQGTFAEINITKSQINDLFPESAGTTKYLKEDGSWEVPPDNQGVISITPGEGLVNDSNTQTAITDSGTLKIKEGGITNAMLAGSIANEKLANYSITIAGSPVNLGGNLAAATLRENLGLSAALRFIGSTTTTMSDGWTGIPAGISIYTGTGAIAPAVGDVVIQGEAEYVCINVSGTTYTWEMLGRDSSLALDSAVIHNTLLSTKGDIIYASDANIPARLAIGTGNNKFLTINGGVPVWGIVEKGDIGLENVTNHAQVTSLQWDSTNKKITYKVSEATTATEVVQFVQGSNITLTAEAGKITIAGTDNNEVTQAYSTIDNSYPILFSAKPGITSTDTRGTATAIVNNAIYANPSTGTIYATKFHGDGSEITNLATTAVKTALGTDNSTTATFLRKDGTWQTISVTAEANNSGSVVTGVNFNQGTFPTLTENSGKAATFTVTNGILIIEAGSDAALTTGTLPSLGTISKANLSINMS